MWNLPINGLHIENFIAGYKQLAPNINNSLMMVIPEAILSALLGSLNGYLLSKWKFRGSNLIFSLILFGMFIPYQSILIPLVKFMQAIKLYGDIPGLILVHIIYGIPITTLIFRNYYAGIGTEILEAGRIDGASLMGLYRYIMFPLSAPSFAVVIIWQFTQAWNEFLFRSHPDQSIPLACDGGTEQPGRQPTRAMECSDGSHITGSLANPAGLHLPRSLFPARIDGGSAQGLKYLNNFLNKTEHLSDRCSVFFIL